VREISQETAIRDPTIGQSKGQYRSGTNEMVLVKDLWCVKTVIHETLHAVSSTQQLEEAIQLKPLFEGLTECLAGYLLYKKYPPSFNCWKDNPDSWCRMSYAPFCRLWGSFFRFVPIKTVIPLYFEFPPDWRRACQRFVDAVRQSGYRDFPDVLGEALSSTPSMYWIFRSKCRGVFGKRFTIFCGTSIAIDFSIKVNRKRITYPKE